MATETKNTSIQVGPGFGGLLFLVFLVLKLTGHIGWSWWWVTAPLWAPLVVVFAIAAVGGIVWVVATGVVAAWALLEKRWRR